MARQEQDKAADSKTQKEKVADKRLGKQMSRWERHIDIFIERRVNLPFGGSLGNWAFLLLPFEYGIKAKWKS